MSRRASARKDLEENGELLDRVPSDLSESVKNSTQESGPELNADALEAAKKR